MFRWSGSLKLTYTGGQTGKTSLRRICLNQGWKGPLMTEQEEISGKSLTSLKNWTKLSIIAFTVCRVG